MKLNFKGKALKIKHRDVPRAPTPEKKLKVKHVGPEGEVIETEHIVYDVTDIPAEEVAKMVEVLDMEVLAIEEPSLPPDGEAIEGYEDTVPLKVEIIPQETITENNTPKPAKDANRIRPTVAREKELVNILRVILNSEDILFGDPMYKEAVERVTSKYEEERKDA